jgi:catechol 2,3-dioxygenase-like lactoylglutathione lyase family enzyme
MNCITEEIEMKFDHVGLTTEKEQPNERFVKKTRVWVTDPQLHPFKIEWLRYCDDSPVADAIRNKPHVAFKVENIEKAAEGLKVLIEPFASVSGHVVGFYETPDGAVVELMEYDD